VACFANHAGTVVAVKVRHPGVSEAMERDFGLMMAAAQAAAALPALRDLRLQDSLKQFAAPLREQVGPWAGGAGEGLSLVAVPCV
jgi:predicted unusual protein kinase regulating ubiquinone biosynthesis (AarF/ABC1/UbiB family)